jgi:glutamyl-tRNA reductase
MIDGLTVINLKVQATLRPSNGEVFVLKTCQRTLIVGFGQLPFFHLSDQNDIRDMYTSDQAYIFLLETICGLKSEVLAEYEVVGQFKEAYNEYTQLPFKKNYILTLLEKLLQDSKKIRTDHLTEIGQLSYAGITRKLITSRTQQSEVLIIGSGNLSVDLIKLLKKKHRVFLSARNSKRVAELAEIHSLEVIPWLEYATYKNFDSIVNTIGCDEVLFENSFFKEWPTGKVKKGIISDDNCSSQTNGSDTKLFIDLGSPSVIKTSLSQNEGVLRLEDIFQQSAKMNIEKMEKIKCAKESIVKLCKNRRQTFSISHPFGWEELRLA